MKKRKDNNMLCGIIGIAEMLRESTTDGDLRGLAQEIISIGKRSAKLNDQLLAFSRKGQIQKTGINLHTTALCPANGSPGIPA